MTVRTPYGALPAGWADRASMSEQHDRLQARLGRRSLLKGAALAALGSPGLWVQPSAASAASVLSRHVGFGADPQRAAVVSFGVHAPFRKAVVEYGVHGFDSTAEVEVRTVRGVPTVYGHARLDGLEPGTPYRYRVRLDDATGDPRTLRTAPDRPAAFTFTAFGDQGVSSAAHAIVRQVARVRPSFHLLTGDLCYADSSGKGGIADVFTPTIWDTWLAMIDPVASQAAWMCQPGNHDMEPGFGPQGYDGYLSRFLVPQNGAPGAASTYTFRYGDVAFVALDSNDVSYEIPHNLGYTGGRQTAWLAAQLAQLRAPGSGVEFIVVVFHHCAYSTGNGHSSEGGIREHWVPLFDRYEVDLVINGHAHAYERTSQLRGGKITGVAPRSSSVDARTGTTYITAGGGGQTAGRSFTAPRGFVVTTGERHAEPAPWSLPTRTTEHAFLAVEVTTGTADRPAAMAVRALGVDGRAVDEVTLLGRGAGARAGTARSLPWLVGGAAVAAGAAGVVAVRGRRGRPDPARADPPPPEAIGPGPATT